MGRRKLHGLSERSLYLNANLIYSEALNCIRKENWKRNIRTGTLPKLRQEGYKLVTSILTRMEVMQRLTREENLPINLARKIYFEVLLTFSIYEITSLDKVILLHNSLIDKLATSNLDFKDALHLLIAKYQQIPLCTHDKKLRGNFSNHETKTRFYEEVYKPQELIKK
ncbi:TPA: PIN domain-containing protein [Candidatus Woesearchaeota archaeon]|nr:PIN domain-containing protein [Candidatus Woesearchaeota archaeon]